MADKEERYFIHKIFDKGKSIRGDEFITFYNDYGVEFTRQEAIERIAKALCKSDGICTSHDCENCTEWCGNDILVAELALNALLGAEK